ncbi:hypothetical protein WR25_09840 isoform A [Diploscapter pachys]|uniref:peroxidase n=1 Tax=Diploscapter pachys TaxID=2018661 RepID=A0A2A2KUN2_9BILA|nr:hypothetical protein WR25_09840 isoform A [Diploscapter pachys]
MTILCFDSEPSANDPLPSKLCVLVSLLMRRVKERGVKKSSSISITSSSSIGMQGVRLLIRAGLCLWLFNSLPFTDGQRSTPSFGDDDNPITVRFHCRRNGCCDQHEWCRFWASVGECKTNAEWMIANCELACGTCRRRNPDIHYLVTTTSLRPFISRHDSNSTTSPSNQAPCAPSYNQTCFKLTFSPLVVSADTAPFPSPANSLHLSAFPSTSTVLPFKPTKRTHLVGISRRLPSESSQQRVTFVPTFQTTPAQTTPFLTQQFELTTTPTLFSDSNTLGSSFFSSTNRPAPFTFTTFRPAPFTFTTFRPAPAFTFRPQTRRPFFFRPFSGTRITTTRVFTTTTPTTTTTTSTTRLTTTTTPTTTAPVVSLQFIPSFSDQLDTPDSPSNERPQPPVRRPPVTRRPAPTTRRPTHPFTTRRPTFPTTTRRTFRPSSTTRFTFTTSRGTTRPTTTATESTTTTRFASRQETSQMARCREILNDPIVAAEEMWRERLASTTEDNSRRQTVDLDQVIRSNLANACVPRLDETDCESNICYNVLYRTMDGTCNNLRKPLQGAAYRPYTRLLPTVYDNGLSEPVGSLFPQTRPPPRAITRRLTSSQDSIESTEFNALIMQFGQFISHDMAKTTLVPSSKCNVCQNVTSRCMMVPLERDEPNSNFKKNGCIRVSRSSPICGSGKTKPRQQLSENTGYIDASPIYGSSVHDSQKFRNGNTGFLKLPMFNGMLTLPFDQTKCRNRADCNVVFTAGDSRVNLFVGLSAWHTIFTREHNRIANVLSRLNPRWSGDRVFLETRKIVGAEVQAIVYREWLPKILGAAFASVVGDYRGYDPSIDATIANEFTSAAFRFGHGMIQEVYQRLDTSFRNISFGALPLQHGTLHSDVLVNEGGVDPIIRGMFSQHVKRPQRVAMTISENMFGSTDLSSINIQRGRDHGHQSYTKYRELCGMDRANSFEDLSREILHPGTRNKLRNVYGDVNRIDLWVGALMEDPVIRGLVGPTVACIVGPQFRRTRDGDRLYYENPGVFTRRQLSEIRKSSLSRIICDNTNTITMIPREAFRVGHLTPCSQIPRMDLNHWRD